MKCVIRHEGRGRLRVHLCCARMTLREADLLKYSLHAVEGVTEVKIYDRTQDAVVLYRGKRKAVLRVLGAFSFAKAETLDLVPEHTLRALNRKFEDKLAGTVMRRMISKLFLPVPVTTAISLFRSVKYIREGAAGPVARYALGGRPGRRHGPECGQGVAEKVGETEVLAEDKTNFIREEKAKGHTVIMTGNGVNDSPALSEADAGIAISTGAAIAREIADITIASENLFALVTLRRLSEALMAQIHQNYRTIVCFNLMLIILGVVGLIPPTTSALLHNASTLGISLHSMTSLLPEEEKNN